jgi:peptide/nickel transport system ATP-binding protein
MTRFNGNSKQSQATSPKLSVRDAVTYVPDGSGLWPRRRKILDSVSLDVAAGEVVALVGESGSGKSTLGRVVSGLLQAESGRVLIDGQPRRRRDRRVQLVFQDPFASLNPVHTVAHHIERPLALHTRLSSSARRTRAAELLANVGLDPALLSRRPHALSGGQRQRVAIARALAADPEIIVADEPTSMLDVSTRAGVLALLRKLADDRRLAILFITHDLASAAAVANRVLVLYAGRLVEAGPTATVLAAPAHPYTRLLLAAAPRAGDGRTSRVGDEPAPELAEAAPAEAGPAPDGCPFALRCPHVLACCRRLLPEPRVLGADHVVRCHLYSAEGVADHAALP